jgi:hypothetical protein
MNRFIRCSATPLLLVGGLISGCHASEPQAKAGHAGHEVAVCDLVKQIRLIPFRPEQRGMDAAYDQLMAGKDYSLSAIADCVDDVRPMPDPRGIPARASNFVVGDAAFFVVMDRTGSDFSKFLPPEALKDEKTRGAYVYFDWVGRRGNREALEKKVKVFTQGK